MEDFRRFCIIWPFSIMQARGLGGYVGRTLGHADVPNMALNFPPSHAYLESAMEYKHAASVPCRFHPIARL